jgi:hypothetical protein
MESGLTASEALLLGERGRGFDDFGGSWMWIILLFLLFGFNGNTATGASEGIATREAVNSGFQYNQLDNGIRYLANGLSDGFYAVNDSMKDGFYGITTAVKDCCCTTNRNIDSVRFDMSRGFADTITAASMNTRDILEAQSAGVQRILDYLCANEKQNLRDRIQTLETSAMLQAQSANLTTQLRPYPSPAYIVSSPYATAPAGYPYGYGYGCGI